MADEQGPWIDTNPGHHICINLLAPGTQKPILEIQVTSKVHGGFNPTPPPPIIYLDTWISNIDFLYTGNQRINANMVTKREFVMQALQKAEGVCRIPHLSQRPANQ